MTYKNRIVVLQETMKANADKIKELSVDPVANKDTIAKLISENIELGKEVSRLNKLEWEEKHERIDLEDDR